MGNDTMIRGLRASVSLPLVSSLIACLSGCQSERITTTDVPISAGAADVWSGGTLVLHSYALAGADTLPIVTVGPETLAVRSFGAESALVQLPDTNGPITLAVKLRGAAPRALDPIRVHGFLSAGTGPRVSGMPYPWPGGPTPTALAYQDGRLVLVDYRYGTAAPLLPDTGLGNPCGSGPVPSALEPGLVTVARRSGSTCGPMVAMPIPPGTPLPDTGPPPASSWPAMQLGRGRWLRNERSNNVLLVGSAAAGFTTVASGLPGAEPSGFAISPRGDRVTLIQAFANGGPPVFEPNGPSVAYRLQSLSVIGGAAFSADGDTLFAAGMDSALQPVFLGIDAATGRVLASAALPTGSLNFQSASSVAVDPQGPWVYVAGWRDGLPYVEVFDRATLTRATTLRVPAERTGLKGYTRYALWMDLWVLLVSPVERRLYLTVNPPSFSYGGPSLPSYVLRFDLMP